MAPNPRAAYDFRDKIALGRQIVAEMQPLFAAEDMTPEMQASIQAVTTAYLGLASMLEAQANQAASVAAAAGA